MPGKAGRASAERNASGGAGAEAARKGRSLASLVFFSAAGEDSGWSRRNRRRELRIGREVILRRRLFFFAEDRVGKAAPGGGAAVRQAEGKEARSAGKMKGPLRAAGAAKGRAGAVFMDKEQQTIKRRGKESGFCRRKERVKRSTGISAGANRRDTAKKPCYEIKL